MRDELNIRAELTLSANSVALYIAGRTNGRFSVCESLVLAEADETLCHAPVAYLKASECQVLMDDLWRAGIRPTEGAGTAGSMRATENHLADMRKIVAAKLGVEL